MFDTLVVQGFGSLDGDYRFDLLAFIREGDPDALTYREWHRIKTVSGVRAGEFIEAWDAGDLSLQLAVALVVLGRKGKNVTESDLWDAPGSSTIRYVIDWDARKETAEADDDDPPVSGPLADGESGSDTTNGGKSLRPSLVSPETDPSRTGVLGTAISGRATSVT
jgi:hypothetical protein